MKKLLFVFCCLINFCSFGMETSEDDFQDFPVSEDRKTASLLEAYMCKAMKRSKPKEFAFCDYENPALFHSYPIKRINELIYEGSEIVAHGFTEEQEKCCHNSLEKMRRNPWNLTDHDAKNIQYITLADFLSGNDMKGILYEVKDKVMAHRMSYLAAWGTRDVTKIENALKNINIHIAPNSYVTLRVRIQESKSYAEHFENVNDEDGY